MLKFKGPFILNVVVNVVSDITLIKLLRFLNKPKEWVTTPS